MPTVTWVFLFFFFYFNSHIFSLSYKFLSLPVLEFSFSKVSHTTPELELLDRNFLHSSWKLSECIQMCVHVNTASGPLVSFPLCLQHLPRSPAGTRVEVYQSVFSPPFFSKALGLSSGCSYKADCNLKHLHFLSKGKLTLENENLITRELVTSQLS